MRKIWLLILLAGCTGVPQVNWPPGPVAEAPALRPIEDFRMGEPAPIDAAGAALAARAAALKARVAEGG